MKRKQTLLVVLLGCDLAAGLRAAPVSGAPVDGAGGRLEGLAPKSAEAIAWSQTGAKAGAGYQGDGLAVTPTEQGARLRCAFQRLDGEATAQGLWLTSTATNTMAERFRVRAAEAGRVTGPTVSLPAGGTVTASEKVVRFARPGLVEEYSVSMDGVRQDFVVMEKPVGGGELRVRLAVAGVAVEPAGYGAQLVLESSGRKIAYSRLRATDATGRELPARIEVLNGRDGWHRAPDRARDGEAVERVPTGLWPHSGVPMLAVLVNDAGAVYPVRIDPTFSDGNWISTFGVPGANFDVYAAVVDSLGNLYIGGAFTYVGGTPANHVAKWNGSSWSALGSGTGGTYPHVLALAVSGNDLYAGGLFTTAGGSVANYIAKWNGSSWSALGSGMEGSYGPPAVYTLAVSDNDLYAGGSFSRAGGSLTQFIAKWNGSSWSALGSGMNLPVYVVAVWGSDLYAGGEFTMAGGSGVNYIAKWNGSSWSALGSGVDNYVNALAVSGSDLYAGGGFRWAGGGAASYVAKWNGSGWSALGSGMDYYVNALAVSGNDLYAGGEFTTAGGSGVNYIAKWNGSGWSALGSGMNGSVYGLAVWRSDLYAGGTFTTAGGKASGYVASAIVNPGNWLAIQTGVPGPSTNTLTYVGIPTNQYVVRFATNLTTSPWLPLATNTTAADGRGALQDPGATNDQRFYRVTTP